LVLMDEIGWDDPPSASTTPRFDIDEPLEDR
jgi:hypothetical protein